MAIKVDSKKTSNKQSKKTEKDGFAKKEQYILTVPASMFANNVVGTTILTRQNTAILTEKKLQGRTFYVNQGELQNDCSFRKYKFVCTHVTGKDVHSTFAGMSLTTDKERSIPKKWHTLIDAVVDVCTADQYVLRVFVMAVTRKMADHVKRHCYAKTSQVKEIRRAMVQVVQEEMQNENVVEVVKKVANDYIDKRIEEMASMVLPLQNCHVSRIKVLSRPKVSN